MESNEKKLDKVIQFHENLDQNEKNFYKAVVGKKRLEDRLHKWNKDEIQEEYGQDKGEKDLLKEADEKILETGEFLTADQKQKITEHIQSLDEKKEKQSEQQTYFQSHKGLSR